MKTINISGYKLKVYDSIQELPIRRYHLYTKWLMLESGIGSDIDSILSHIDKIKAFMYNDRDNAIKELENMRDNIYTVYTMNNIGLLAFAALIHSIGDKEYHLKTDDEIEEIKNILLDIRKSEYDEIFEKIKDNIESELILYFPNMFQSSSTKEYYTLIQKRSLLLAEQMIKDIDLREKIESLDHQIITFWKPKVYHGEKGEEIKLDKDFESMCVMISQKLNIKPKDLSVLEYYTSVEYINKIAKEQEKHMKSTKSKRRV